jgi:hypothetical protein
VKAVKARKAQLEKELEQLNKGNHERIAKIEAQEELDDENEEHLHGLAGNGMGEVSHINQSFNLVIHGRTNCDKVSQFTGGPIPADLYRLVAICDGPIYIKCP